MTSPSRRLWSQGFPLAAAFLFSACSGGGGGDAPPGPITSPVVLTQAVFQGQTPADMVPDAGDKLILIFSGDVSLVAAARIDSADLSILTGTNAGGVGSQGNPPTATTSRSIEITLGAGTSFTPGTSTLALLADQDAVLDSRGNLVQTSTAVTIKNSDGNNPNVDLLTLNAIPSDLNGDGSAGGTLQVPPTGFSIDLTYSDPSSPIDTGTLILTSTVALQLDATSVLAGTNLTPLLTASIGAGNASLQVPGNLVFPDGSQALLASIADITGNTSAIRTFTFTVKTPTDALRPLENGQLWFIDTSRDIESLRSTTSDGGTTINFPIDNLPFPNGIPDFHESLIILGLRTQAPIPNVSGSKDSNQVTRELLQGHILTQLGILFQGTGVSFTFNAPGSFPSGASSTGYSSFGFSQISLGGSSDVAALGIAQFDPNNTRQEDDTLHPDGSPTAAFRLGVFPHTLTANGVNLSGSYFRSTFDAILDHRGLPVGEDPGDKARLQSLLASGSGDTRQNQIGLALVRLGRILAVTLAHECGHSMGLVQDGALPLGIFGASSSFPGSSSGHLNLATTSIFPLGAQEVMSPSISFQGANHIATGFNPLFRAYFKETMLYGQ